MLSVGRETIGRKCGRTSIETIEPRKIDLAGVADDVRLVWKATHKIPEKKIGRDLCTPGVIECGM